MNDRIIPVDRFLATAGWSDATRTPLAGDASPRRYERLKRTDGGSAVLMDAPPHRGQDVRQFMRVARHISDLGLSAPLILAADETQGLLLLEDLGDRLFARVLREEGTSEQQLYLAAIDVLVVLQRALPPSDLPVYDASTMASAISSAFDWYAREICPTERESVTCALLEVLHRHSGEPIVFMHRDYHAENLLWLPDRSGAARVGVIDFQDAHLCHPAYDVMSLLEDARRDVSEDTRHQATRHYLAQTGMDEHGFTAAFYALGAQRNLRLLGVLGGLSKRDGKPQYADLIPRVWKNLQRDLSHPALADLARAVAILPAPSKSILESLKEPCTSNRVL